MLQLLSNVLTGVFQPVDQRWFFKIKTGDRIVTLSEVNDAVIYGPNNGHRVGGVNLPGINQTGQMAPSLLYCIERSKAGCYSVVMNSKEGAHTFIQ